MVDDKPFGTLIDVYEPGYECIGHSIRTAAVSDPETFCVSIGGPQCQQPYSASVFNISAMSFGSLSGNAILALNRGAKLGGFYHDTGEAATIANTAAIWSGNWAAAILAAAPRPARSTRTVLPLRRAIRRYG